MRESFCVVKKVHAMRDGIKLVLPEEWGFGRGDVVEVRVREPAGGAVLHLTTRSVCAWGPRAWVSLPREWRMDPTEDYNFEVVQVAYDDGRIGAQEADQGDAQGTRCIRGARGAGGVLQDRRPGHGGVLQGALPGDRGQDVRGTCVGLAGPPYEAGGGRGGHLRRSPHGGRDEAGAGRDRCEV